MWQQNRVMEFFCCAVKTSGKKIQQDTARWMSLTVCREREREKESHLVCLQRELWLCGFNHSGLDKGRMKKEPCVSAATERRSGSITLDIISLGRIIFPTISLYTKQDACSFLRPHYLNWKQKKVFDCMIMKDKTSRSNQARSHLVLLAKTNWLCILVEILRSKSKTEVATFVNIH